MPVPTGRNRDNCVMACYTARLPCGIEAVELRHCLTVMMAAATTDVLYQHCQQQAGLSVSA